jgi:hypothetical protein
MIKLELTPAEVGIILALISSHPDKSDFLDTFYNAIFTQAARQIG